MNDLDKKLRTVFGEYGSRVAVSAMSAIRDEGFVSRDLYIDRVKQAFKEAGYEIIPIGTIPTFKSYLKQAMTGQEWYEKFEDKLDITINYRTADEYQGKMELVEQIKRCARRAAGIEEAP